MEEKVRICNRCHLKVYPSCLDEYEYQCFEHDEDLYSIETTEISKEIYIADIAQRLKCSKKEALVLYDQYDCYIQNLYLHDVPVECPMTIVDYYNSQEMSTMNMR